MVCVASAMLLHLIKTIAASADKSLDSDRKASESKHIQALAAIDCQPSADELRTASVPMPEPAAKVLATFGNFIFY